MTVYRARKDYTFIKTEFEAQYARRGVKDKCFFCGNAGYTVIDTHIPTLRVLMKHYTVNTAKNAKPVVYAACGVCRRFTFRSKTKRLDSLKAVVLERLRQHFKVSPPLPRDPTKPPPFAWLADARTRPPIEIPTEQEPDYIRKFKALNKLH